MKATIQGNFITITECTSYEYDCVVKSFTREHEGYKYVKNRGGWDGKICYVYGSKIPCGLYAMLGEVAGECGFPLELTGTETMLDEGIDRDEFNAWCEEFFAESEMKPRDYQIESAYRILRNKRCLSELATSAGKTLICFMVIAYVLAKRKATKVLMIVPTIQLIDQSAKDFETYNDGRISVTVNRVGGGNKTTEGCEITVGTFQSLTKWDAEKLAEFDCVIVDECHRAKSKSIKTILERCVNCDYRFGVSGTLPAKKSLDFLTLLAYIGPVVTEVKAKELQDRGFISNCKIVQLRVDYTDEETKDIIHNAHKECMRMGESTKSFNLEKNFVIENAKRLRFVTDLLMHTTKNTLVLFQHLAYGKLIYNTLRDVNTGKRIYYIDGSTPKDTRNTYTANMDLHDNVILVASFQVLSTGVSVNHIYNVVFTESYRSPNIIIQSIGRSLRLKSKDNPELNHATIIDIVDDFRVGKHMNYMYRHGMDRVRGYKAQKYPYEIKYVKL